MAMSGQPKFIDTTSWPLAQSSRQGSIASSLSSPSDTTSIHFANLNLPPTPALSGLSGTGRPSINGAENNVHVPLTRPVNIAFNKGSKLFKLRYAQIQLRRDVAGHLKCIELSDPAGLQSTFIHTFPGTKVPIPHLEQPVTSSTTHISRVSFLEEQNVQTAQTLFQAQPQYTFETWEGEFLPRAFRELQLIGTQTAYIFKKLCSARRSCSPRALPKRNPRGEARSVSAKICGS
jgi:hypothetical protein